MVKKLIPLILSLMLAVSLCSTHAEDLSGMSTDELKALRNAVDAEINSRINAVMTAAEQATTSANQFTYGDNGEEVMIRGYVGNEPDIVIPSEINGLPVTRIAEAVGIGDVNYFSRLFRQKTGITPTTYQKQGG